MGGGGIFGCSHKALADSIYPVNNSIKQWQDENLEALNNL